MTMRENYAKLIADKKKRTLLMRELRQLHLERISAGIHKADGKQVVSDNGFRLIDVAVQNEYGNSWTLKQTVSFMQNDKWYHLKKGTRIEIPATHFVGRIVQDPTEKRNLIDVFKANLHILLKYGNVGEGDTVREFIKDVGSYMKQAIKSGIDRKIFKANAPMTIDIKGFDQRLYDKGLLYKSIKYRSKKAKVNSD